MSSETAEKFKAFKAAISESAESHLRELFPRKTLELEKLLREISSTDFSSTQTEDVIRGAHKAKESQSVTGVSLPAIRPPCNVAVVKMMEKLKPELIDVLEQLNGLKMWINMNIPKTQDGNNFGAAIQSETFSELARIEGDVAALYESIPWYYANRAKLIARCMKYPQVEDHLHTVSELDNKQKEALYMMCAELRNIYCCLNDMVLKNLDKLQKPTSTGPNMMY
ncbi:proteasome activator complex subunit 3-like [Sycon ciliatum]|uniref:proteasome activator complex subunit 3-like n=1 Tax=Sycon ciliatum TaxID=27933 RepID=UPI0020A98DB2|eukprot:scpid76564/ scgid30046/ Proteasome activator complex subunit 3; Activator of multicatalytic protease subunit 3; Proteasome activator 28 subunit gamma